MEAEYFQLVLSVFRGFNFVVKKPGGVKCKIISKVNDSLLESQVVHLNTNNSEPEFNSQVAWKLTKKQFQDLRLNRGVVKVECHLLNKEEQIASLIGYCNISIKEAIEIQSFDEVDSKNATTIPLSGTKSPWLQYGPKLLIMLHYEDPKKNIVPSQKRKYVVKSPVKKDTKFKTPLPPPPTASTMKFSWSINAEKGYFQLGDAQPDDDFYVMNITLISVKDLDKYMKNSKPPDSWRISFEAFGVNVLSDVFQLSKDSGSSFLGDKTTARIRANSAEFIKFLMDHQFILKVESLLADKTEHVGNAYISLEALTNKEVHEVRGSLDIIAVKPTPASQQGLYPQLQVTVDLTVSYKFFARYAHLEEISCAAQNITTSKESLDKLDDLDSNHVRPKEARQISDEREEADDVAKQKGTSPMVPRVGEGDEKREQQRATSSAPKENGPTSSSVTPQHQSQQQKNIANTQVEELSKQMEKFSVLTPITPPEKTISSRPIVHSLPNSAQISVPSTIREVNHHDGAARISIPNLNNVCCDPGEFELQLKFNSFNVKSKKTILDNWKLSLQYSILDIGPENKCELLAKLEPSKLTADNVNHFGFDDDEDEKWKFSIPRFTKELLETPLEIYFEKELQSKEHPIARSLIYIGNIFCMPKSENGRVMRGQTPIFAYYRRNNEKDVKIGFLFYEFILTERSVNESGAMFEDSQSLLLNPVSPEKEKSRHSKESRKFRQDSKGNNNDTAALLEWRQEEEDNFKQKLKEREQSYMQILAAEYKKHKEEGEKAVNDKLDELSELKKEYSRRLRELTTKEEALKERENKAELSAREKEQGLTKSLENSKIEIRSLKENHRIELISLSKQLEQLKVENEAYKGKNRILEEKLALKEEKCNELLALSNKWPVHEAQRKYDLLEQRCDQLQKDLDAALKDKQNYKSQIQNLVKVLDRKSEESKEQLKEENKNLKLQLIASRQQELLTKDREQVATVCNEIRLAKDNLVKQQPLRSSSVNTRSPEEILDNRRIHTAKPDSTALDRELQKLMDSREALLKTQAYTRYDPLIRKLEEEIERKLQTQRESSRS